MSFNKVPKNFINLYNIYDKFPPLDGRMETTNAHYDLWNIFKQYNEPIPYTNSVLVSGFNVGKNVMWQLNFDKENIYFWCILFSIRDTSENVLCKIGIFATDEKSKFDTLTYENCQTQTLVKKYFLNSLNFSKTSRNSYGQIFNNLASVNSILSNNGWVGYGSVYTYSSYTPNTYTNTGNFWYFKEQFFVEKAKSDFNKDISFSYNLISPIYGEASTEDGYETPNFDNTSDNIPLPQAPQVGVTNVGFANVYKTSLNALRNFGEELFPDIIPPEPVPTTENVSDAIVNGFNNVVGNLTNLLNSYINNNLINFVIDCHIIPCVPEVNTQSENIKVGFRTFNTSAERVTNDYVDVDCGTLEIAEYYNNFIDYVGTRAKLYLPFIGFVDIQNEYFQNGKINVLYRFNVIDGSFMCFIRSTSSKSELNETVIATYSGNCCVHLPITGSNYASMVTSLVNGAVGIATGNPTAMLNSAMGVMSVKPQLQSSNSYNATSSFLGIRTPYLLIEREVSNFSENYPNEKGLPCNVTKKLSEVSGFTVIDNIHLDINATENEKNELQSIFASGVIL